MNINPPRTLFEYCKAEKEQAMKLATCNHSKTRYNASQAVNAWDELMGQLHKNKPVSPARFEKTKETALRIISLMANSPMKSETRQKIMALELPAK